MSDKRFDVPAITDAAFTDDVTTLPVKELHARLRRAVGLDRTLSRRLEIVEALLAGAPPAGLHDRERAELGGTERRLREDAASLVHDRDAARRAADTLGQEIGRRYRLGLTSIDEMLQG